MARKLTITTPRGDRYYIHEKGEIERADGHNGRGSDTWLFLGLQHVKRREFIPLEALTPERIKSLTLLYKNGHPQYTVRDRDHGTTREWGNTHHGGVKEIYPVTAD